MAYTRFAIYYVPPEGPLARFGASWLGWDLVQARKVVQPDLPDLSEVTMTPRKYGFHATLKPPFRLAEWRTPEELDSAVSALAGTLAPVTCDGLKLVPLGRFLALVPRGDQEQVENLAATCVRTLDPFRAPLDEAELARRRKPGLSSRQEALLQQWGYPYVLEQFRFHMTLSGRLPRAELPEWTEILRRHLPPLPTPFHLDQIALFAERTDGRFQLLQRYKLSG